MKIKLHYVIRLTIALVICIIYGSLIFVRTSEAQIVIIANTSISENEISKNDLKDMFLGIKLKWSDSKDVKLIVLKGTETHEAFLKNYIKKRPYQFKNYWKQMLFTGKSVLPKSTESEDAVLEYVEKTEGAIGYISAEPADETVKILIIID